jgi:hypothetical protein
VVNRKTVQTAPSPAYQSHLLALLATLLGGCGGHALYAASDGAAAAGSIGEGGNSDVGGTMASGGNAQGGGGVASGGQSGAGGATSGGGVVVATWQGSGGLGSAPFATGGVTSQGGSASSDQDGGVVDGEILDSPDGSCGDGFFWETIGPYLAGLGVCGTTSNGLPGPSGGYVVLGSEGQIVDITQAGVSRTHVVEALASYRWPCVAGQTIPYFCDIGE